MIFDLHRILIWGNHTPSGLGEIVVCLGIGVVARLAFLNRVAMDWWETVSLGAVGAGLAGVTTRLLFGWWAGLVPQVIGAIVLLGLRLRYPSLRPRDG